MAGFIGTNFNIEKLSFSKEVDRIGPTANCFSDTKYFGGYWLAQAKLSDPNAFKQEMVVNSSNSGRYSLLLYGSIYNFNEIIDQTKYRYRYKIFSQEQAILAGMEIFGIDWILDNLRGDFSFAIIDNKKKRVHLARDRFGTKNLFYFIRSNKIMFSTNFKALYSSLKRKDIDLSFDFEGAAEYILFGSTQENRTFVKEIKQVEPSGYVEFEGEITTDRLYYDFPYYKPNEFLRSEIVTNIDFLLHESIEEKIASPGLRTNVYLSGGLISSLLFERINTLNLNSTNIVSITSDGYEEANYNVNTISLFSEEEKPPLPKLIKEYSYDVWKEHDLYLASSLYPLSEVRDSIFAVMNKRLPNQTGVSISGVGADELFFGYEYLNNLDIDTKWSEEENGADYIVDKLSVVSRGTINLLGFAKEINIPWENTRVSSEIARRLFFKNFLPGKLAQISELGFTTGMDIRHPFIDYKLIDWVFKNVDPRSNIIPHKQKKAFFYKLDNIEYFRGHKTSVFNSYIRDVAERFLNPRIIEKEKEVLPLKIDFNKLWNDNIDMILTCSIFNITSVHFLRDELLASRDPVIALSRIIDVAKLKLLLESNLE